MRWTTSLISLAIAALVAALLSQVFGWPEGRTGFLVAAVVLLLPVVIARLPHWISVFTFASAAALLAALVSQLIDWPAGRTWFLLVWALLLLAVVIGLFSHPMRGPAWGLFVGFWGGVAVVWLIVIQILAVAGLLTGSAYGDWAAWPLALLGIWILVASGAGFGAEGYPTWVDALGLLTGAGLIAISVATWIGAPDLMRGAGVAAAIAYCLWSIGLGWVFWGNEPASQRLHGMAVEPAL